MPVTIGLTALAMVAFAANSLLARAALGEGAIDAMSYTLVRLVSGAAVLVAVAALRGGRARGSAQPGSLGSAQPGSLGSAQPGRLGSAQPGSLGSGRWGSGLAGSWGSGLALFGYAIAFSLAYVRLGAATGALVLFASVQATMILWGVARRLRPVAQETAGLAIAFAAFVWLVAPGLEAPDPLGAALMTLSGVAWGAYSLRGRGGDDPLGDTAGNFARAAVLALPLLAAPLIGSAGALSASAGGLALAVASGAVTSGLGYVVWYAALPRLSPTQGAVVQLTVPAIAAAGAALLLAEPLTLRFLAPAAAILGGVALAILAPKRVEGAGCAAETPGGGAQEKR